MDIEAIREIAAILENAYDQFLEAYAVLERKQERGVSSPDIDNKFAQVNKLLGELREYLNEAEHRALDSGSPSRATTETPEIK